MTRDQKAMEILQSITDGLMENGCEITKRGVMAIGVVFCDGIIKEIEEIQEGYDLDCPLEIKWWNEIKAFISNQQTKGGN